MVNNIKIIGNITNTTINSRYSEQDLNLIPFRKIQENFGGKGDYIEYYITDAAENILNINYNYLNYKLPATSNLTPINIIPNTTGEIPSNNTGIESFLYSNTGSVYPIIEIDPLFDLQNNGYSSGEFIVKYNFFKNILSNEIDKALFIKEISDDRTEVRLASITLTNEEIEKTTNTLINEINNSSYYIDYLLNFGNNKQVLAVNVALNKATEGSEILFKLYEPLPLDFKLKDTLWVVEEKVNQYSFNINLDKFIIPPAPLKLRGPNFNIEINNQGTISTQYNTYENLVTNLQSLQSSSYNQILNLINEKGIEINVDYSNFDNFIFFGSAYQRLNNFVDKIYKIDNYNNLINLYSSSISTTSSLQIEINQAYKNINDIISGFDGFEYYMYYESGSEVTSSILNSITPYPKSGSIKPYSLYPVSSSIFNTWFSYAKNSAIYYDENNYDNLEYTLPLFIKEDNANQPFITFINMIGHYFDNIWIYIKSITDINKANNNLEIGISKDLVYRQLKSLGVKLYNSQAGEELDKFLIGNNTGSSVFNEDFSITGSYLNNIPRQDLLAELYKRIYHNLPLLVKTKGTITGLEYLTSIFGISSSILNVKEFGGSYKNDLKGYNNEKVRITPNNITGSVLSSLISLQNYTSESSEYRDNDLNYIDISFSPQTQIDTYISGSISSSNPLWNLDNYIGDPRQTYSSSYIDLDKERILYFKTGTTGYPGYTGSLLDYNGFIRLIQYFDNALFKMLEDFTPERTSLSTGVTINSPVLERNKVSYANISTSTTQSVYNAEYSSSAISSQYGRFYEMLSSSNNTMGWYDGNISGSIVDIYQYFIDNYNQYLQPTGAIDINMFKHSDWNVLLNNVSHSVSSTIRKNIEYIWGTTGSILKPAELQDSYLSLKSYNTSRYEGSKLTSLLYNNYTPATSSYIGDKSYGKTAVIDHNTRKLGLFTQVSTSSFLPGRNSVSIKYLVDEFGGLTELNQRNKYWFEIQNTFIAGDLLNISLFDNKKYSNQKFTDGNKLIFDSGYTYSPLLYFAGSCPSILYFLNLSGANSYYSKAQNSANENEKFISGSIILGHPFSSSFVSKLYDQVVQGNQYFSPGTETTFPSYSAQETGQHYFSASLDLTIEYNYTSQVSSSWYLEAWKSGSSGYTLIKSDNYQFKAGDPATATLTFVWYKDDSFRFTLNEAIPSTNIEITYAKVDGYEDGICNSIIASDNITDSNPLTIVAGDIVVNGFGDTPFSNTPVISNYKMIDSVTVNGTGSLFNNDTFIVGGTTVTLIITNTSCTPYG